MTELDEFKGVHAPGRIEHSLCGMAPEAFESGDAEEPIIFAEIGQVVTCQACKSELDYMRRAFKYYRFTGADS